MIENDIEFDSIYFCYKIPEYKLYAYWTNSEDGSYSYFSDINGVFYDIIVGINSGNLSTGIPHNYVPGGLYLSWIILEGIYNINSYMRFESGRSGVYFSEVVCDIGNLVKIEYQHNIYGRQECYIDSWQENYSNSVEGYNGMDIMCGLRVENDPYGKLTPTQIRNIFYDGFSYSTYIFPSIHEMCIVIESISTGD